MIPNSSWFRTSLQDRAAWYENFYTQSQATGASLGLSPGDLTQIAQDNDMMQFLASSAVALENFNEAVTQFRNIITAGDIGDVAPPFPTIPQFDIPSIPPVGIFERVSDKYRTRIMASAVYTNEQGAAYGIIGGKPEPPDPSDVQPILKTFPSETGNMFSCVVTGRGQADQCQVSAAVAGTTNWQVLGTFTGKSGDITYPNPDDKPVQLQVRVQLRKANADYGHLSSVVMTTINP